LRGESEVIRDFWSEIMTEGRALLEMIRNMSEKQDLDARRKLSKTLELYKPYLGVHILVDRQITLDACTQEFALVKIH
jgi:hypothetical protein